ncbi:MAG: hypothetical protein M1818_005511 [Claussenomyces sp. TS43310]|nr:MAG: hypothetical protein M1818_005511 [Claussenomyces sp. TS43310]
MPTKRKARAAAANPDPENDPSQLTVAELRDELERRGLARSGRKADLISRLAEADATAPPSQLPRPPAAGSKRAKTARSGVTDDGSPAAEVVPDVRSEGESERGEQRLRPFVPAPDATYRTKLARIKRERMFMLARTRSVDEQGYPCEMFEIAGSTGNIYAARIARKPTCACMDAVKNSWEQVVLAKRDKPNKDALVVILKAPSHLCYQHAFLSDELDTIFANAPQTTQPSGTAEEEEEEDETIYNGTRKPISGECSICVFDMSANEDLVWCKAACGQNFHRECFEQWKRSKAGRQVTCVYCRSEWQEDGNSSAAPGSLAGLQGEAVKVGSYRNIGHLSMYNDDQASEIE